MLNERILEDVKYLRDEGFEFKVSEESILWTNPFEDSPISKDEYLNVTHLFVAHVGESVDLIDTLGEYVEKNFRQCEECEAMLDIDEVYRATDEYGRDDHQDGICFECLGDIAEANMDPYALRGLKRSDFI